MIYKIKTKKLIELNKLSLYVGYNKSIPGDLIELLDPDGWHVLRIVMEHQHKNGELCYPHHRCMVWLKLYGTIEPAVTLLDIPLDTVDNFGIDVTEEELHLISRLGGAIDE
tara:strand:- start:222 stop:554 length:333 start_codon:yes stop_codon:yes gene_type:complete